MFSIVSMLLNPNRLTTTVVQQINYNNYNDNANINNNTATANNNNKKNQKRISSTWKHYTTQNTQNKKNTNSLTTIFTKNSPNDNRDTNQKNINNKNNTVVYSKLVLVFSRLGGFTPPTPLFSFCCDWVLFLCWLLMLCRIFCCCCCYDLAGLELPTSTSITIKATN